MTYGDLFSGIGGFRLGLERAGHVYKWACEIDPYRRAVYALNFGHEPEYRDIRECVDPPYVDLITGGFPCQPFSLAGRQRGAADKRNLWPEMLRVIRAVRPMWVLGENVPGITDYFDSTIRPDLEASGYEVLPLEIPAAAFGAPHLRNRLWIVAHSPAVLRERIERRQSDGILSTDVPNSGAVRCEAGVPQVSAGESDTPGCCDVSDAVGQRSASGTERTGRQTGADIGRGGTRADVADSESSRLAERQIEARSERARPCDGLGESGGWSPESGIRRVAHGIPHRVDRLKALGDSVVPQAVQWIGERLMEAEKNQCP